MQLTRRQFGIAMLIGLGSLFLMRIVRAFGFRRNIDDKYADAMFWHRGDRLAG